MALLAALCPQPALAQRTEENVNTQASDAFGRSVGSERNGLYSQEDVRGFNPVDAGNVRLEGLYLDLIDRLPNRLIEGSTIRVGAAAQRIPFPAPTGLVDFRLTLPGSNTQLAVEADNGQGLRGLGGNISAKLPLDGERLGLVVGVGGRRLDKPEGGQNAFYNYSGLIAFRPGKGIEILAFASGILSRGDDARPTYFPSGAAPPPKVPQGTYLGYDWTSRSTDGYIQGLIAKIRLNKGWQFDGGIFRSGRSSPEAFSDLVLGVSPDGTYTRRQIVADSNNLDQSMSGEVRLTHNWQGGDFAHTLYFNLRGRAKDRRFGGSVSLPLGPGSVFSTGTASQPADAPAPAFTLTKDNEDHVRQITGGIAYSVLWQGRASFDVSVAKSSYRKEVDFADPLLVDPITRDNPLLWNVDATVILTRNVSLFGGITRGQEEALVAPEIASNRSEAPPAIRTSQEEVGLRWGINKGLSLVIGAFRITKPYYNLDPALRYRQLGTLTNKGIEISLTGKLAPGLTIVGGTLFLDPKISGEAVNGGLIGPRPVGQISRRTQVNLDWRLDQGKSPLSFDLALESLSSRTANAANTLDAPARAIINLGARYRFAVGGTKAVFRVVLANATNNYGWQVSSSGGWTFGYPRGVTAGLTIDF